MSYKYSTTATHYMISKLSHELRTPLAIIYSNLQFLEDKQLNLENELREEAFNLSYMALRNIIQLLDNISILDKTKNDTLEPFISRVNVSSVVGIMINELSAIKDYKKRVILKNELEQEVIHTDSFLLEKIMSNVITNALKYSECNSLVTVILRQDGQWTRFIIQDKGIGIRKEELEKIYDMFYRGSNTNNIKGTGLGLNIAQKCLEILKGEIEITSQINAGTDVKISIPYDKQ